MAKLTVRVAGGWPLMEPLGKKETELLRRNLTTDETILGQVIGNFGQAIVATNHKVLVVKTGLMAGQTFGGKATSFDYRTLVGVEVRSGFGQGEFELMAGGLLASQGNRNRDKVKVNESPNGVVFPKTNQKWFDQMAGMIREMTAAAHGSGTSLRPAQAPESATSLSSIPDQIKQLADLHQAGVLTHDEFNAKKAELLGRM